MIGNVVYIIVCHYIPDRSRQIETVHATFDGAYKEMQRRAKQLTDFGYEVETDGAYIEARDAVDLLYIYRVSTKTIQE